MSSRILAAITGTALALMMTVFPAVAGTSLFASEGNARSVCGQDKVVWVTLKGGTYYRAGSPGYIRAKDQRTGAYTCEKVARKEGGHVAPDGK